MDRCELADNRAVADNCQRFLRAFKFKILRDVAYYCRMMDHTVLSELRTTSNECVMMDDGAAFDRRMILDDRIRTDRNIILKLGFRADDGCWMDSYGHSYDASLSTMAAISSA